MGQTYWYARDDFDRSPSGPFHADPGDVEVGEGERLRPIDESVLPDDGAESERESEPETVGEAIDDGRCPWCEEYDGDHVGRHASSAHPDAWAEYKDE